MPARVDLGALSAPVIGCLLNKLLVVVFKVPADANNPPPGLAPASLGLLPNNPVPAMGLAVDRALDPKPLTPDPEGAMFVPGKRFVEVVEGPPKRLVDGAFELGFESKLLALVVPNKPVPYVPVALGWFKLPKVPIVELI